MTVRCFWCDGGERPCPMSACSKGRITVEESHGHQFVPSCQCRVCIRCHAPSCQSVGEECPGETLSEGA